jgi:TMEM199 family protein
MVFLTMTTSMVEALEKIRSSELAEEKDELPKMDAKDRSYESGQPPSEQATIRQADEKQRNTEDKSSNAHAQATEITSDEKEDEKSTEPSLENPKVGNPISHGQVIDLSKQMKAQGLSPYGLEILLKGARVYIPPPPPKKEPVSSHSSLQPVLKSGNDRTTS